MHIWKKSIIVIDLKSVKTLKMRFIAPMPEQSGTPLMHFCRWSRTFVMKTFNMGLLRPYRNALLWSPSVLAWVQQTSIFESSYQGLLFYKCCVFSEYFLQDMWNFITISGWTFTLKCHRLTALSRKNTFLLKKNLPNKCNSWTDLHWFSEQFKIS